MIKNIFNILFLIFISNIIAFAGQTQEDSIVVADFSPVDTFIVDSPILNNESEFYPVDTVFIESSDSIIIQSIAGEKIITDPIQQSTNGFQNIVDINSEITKLRLKATGQTTRMVIDYSLGIPILIVATPGTLIGLLILTADSDDDDYDDETRDSELVAGVFIATSVVSFIVGAVLVLKASDAKKKVTLYKSNINVLQERKKTLSFQGIIPGYNLKNKTTNLAVSFSF